MIEISIESSGLILISGKSTVEKIEDISKLTGKILDFIEKDQPENKTKVLLKADDNVAYGKVVDVMNEIKNAEIEVIGLVTKKIAR
jgi:biopolymer transport protein ExbD